MNTMFIVHHDAEQRFYARPVGSPPLRVELVLSVTVAVVALGLIVAVRMAGFDIPAAVEFPDQLLWGLS